MEKSKLRKAIDRMRITIQLSRAITRIPSEEFRDNTETIMGINPLLQRDRREILVGAYTGLNEAPEDKDSKGDKSVPDWYNNPDGDKPSFQKNIPNKLYCDINRDGKFGEVRIIEKYNYLESLDTSMVHEDFQILRPKEE